MPRYVELAFNLPVAKLFTYALPEGMQAAVGCRAAAPFGARALTGLVAGLRDAPPEGVGEIREVKRIIDSRPLFGESTLELARWMARMYMCSLGEALFSMLPGGRRESETDELPLDEEPRSYELAPQQRNAIDAITSKGEGSFYLFGVTGSGKTDVYLSVAQHVTASGRGVIYLVPEISLTHQVVRIFHSLYRKRLAVLHSALTPSQRLKEWLRVLDGEVDVVIGARSAIFAPFPRLGLIVIDEEHEGAYKSGSAPRYHARQVAMRRASQEKAILIMGSATPSLEAYHHMSQGGITSLRLPDRLSGGKLPAIEVVDMRRQAGSAFSPPARRDREDIHRGQADHPLPQQAGILVLLPLPLVRLRDALPALLRCPDLSQGARPDGLPLLRVVSGADPRVPPVRFTRRGLLGLRHRGHRGGDPADSSPAWS